MSVPDQSTIALLQQISKRLDGLEQRVATLTDAANRVPAMTGMLTDIVDEAARREGGAELDERVRATGHLLLKLSEPRTLHALERVLARMETVDDMLAKAEELPNLVAMAVDSFDEAARLAAERGVNLEQLLTNSLTAAGKVSEILDSPQFSALMESGVLSPSTLSVNGRAASALAESGSTDSGRAGPVRLLRAMRDPDVQRALDFMLRVASRFGRGLDSLELEAREVKQLTAGRSNGANGKAMNPS